jgi:hypothetical protein
MFYMINKIKIYCIHQIENVIEKKNNFHYKMFLKIILLQKNFVKTCNKMFI